MTYVFGFFMNFRFFQKKMRLSMPREIQNPLMFETDPESFSPAKNFSLVHRGHVGTAPGRLLKVGEQQ
jgi:hypothetical protein